MKTTLLILFSAFFIGCGDDRPDPSINGNSAEEKFPQLYTLEDHYNFRMKNHDVELWGVAKAFGHATEIGENGVALWMIDSDAGCGIRMLVNKTDVDNTYTVRIGAGDGLPDDVCATFRGTYALNLTGPTTATINYLYNDDSTF